MTRAADQNREKSPGDGPSENPHVCQHALCVHDGRTGCVSAAEHDGSVSGPKPVPDDRLIADPWQSDALPVWRPRTPITSVRIRAGALPERSDSDGPALYLITERLRL